MKVILTSLFLVAGALAQSPTFTINTPANAVVCQPLLLNWVGGTPPYFLSILPGGQPGAAALVDLGQQNGNSFTWLVNQPVGTSLGLNLRDSTGQVAQSAPFPVNTGPDISCVGHDPSSSVAAPGGSTTSGAATTSGATSAAAPTTSAASVPPTTPTTSAAAPPPTVSTKPATTAAATTSASRSSAAPVKTSNAASANLAQIGTAGVVGAALAALLV